MTTEATVLAACVLGALGLASAFVSAVETALFSIPRTEIEALRARRPRLTAALTALLENPRQLLSAILFADALVNVPLVLGCFTLLEEQQAVAIPFWAGVLLVFALIVFVCDLVPKLVALRAPQFVAALGVPVFRTLLPVLAPVVHLLERISERLATALLPQALKTPRHLTEEEMETLVELSTETGALHETESE